MSNANVVAQVKEAYDLADYLRSYGVDLKQAGPGRWKGCCPFHSEKTPSFNVTDGFQHYKCFGCGVSGDIIEFVKIKENLTFMEALKKLAEDRGIVLDITEGDSNIDYTSLRAVMREAALFYWKNFSQLPEDHPAKVEVSKRGLNAKVKSGEGVIYGFAPNGFSNLRDYLAGKGYSEELMVQAGLCRSGDNKKTWDVFRGRLMFFFVDKQGRPIGFSARKLYEDDKFGKYVNTSETPLFHKSKVLFNHDVARKAAVSEKTLYVSEGQFDVAAMCAAGLTNTVASSGTAFTKDQGRETLRLAGEGGKVVFCFDGDNAGIKAAKKVFANIPELHESARVVLFPEEMDPCDFRLKHGDEKLREYVGKSEPLVEFMIRRERVGVDMNSAVDRANFINQASRYVKTITNMTLREACVKLLSLEAMTPIESIRDAVRAAEAFTYSSDATDDESVSESLTETREALVAAGAASNSTAQVDVDEYDEFAEDENTSSNKISDDELLGKIKEGLKLDHQYFLSAKFFAIGTARQSWRAAIVRNAHLLPSEFSVIVDELNELADKKSVFPELFSYPKTVEYLLSKKFSAFEGFMDEQEAKDHLGYLHERLDALNKNRHYDAQIRKITEMLEQGDSTSVDYLKKLMEKLPEAAFLKKDSNNQKVK